MQNDATPQATPTPASLTKSAYAKRHSLSTRTLDNLRPQGLPVWVLSRRKILFPVTECDAWMRERFAIASRRRPTLERLARAAAVTSTGGQA